MYTFVETPGFLGNTATQYKYGARMRFIGISLPILVLTVAHVGTGACDHRMAVRAAVAAGGRESDVPPLGPRYPGAAVTAHLATFPEPEGLVVGSYGEANRGVTDFVSRCGRAAGEREWRSMGARTASEAASIITAQMLRSLSVRVHSGHMRVLYARLRYVGMSAAQPGSHAHRRW